MRLTYHVWRPVFAILICRDMGVGGLLSPFAADKRGPTTSQKVFWVVSVSELRASCVVFGTAFSVFQMGFVWSLCIYTQGQKTYNYTRNNINTARPFFLYLQRRVRMQRLTTAAGLFLCLSKKSAAAWLDNLNCNSTKCRPSHQTRDCM